uniref:Transmembrane BAX inhibitor motif containing 1b n=1 Tax=Paramormyrops kingsleyae TaxID=1676925 RepID=A0A3B3R170_9TELE|nr:protein lifeguard 3 [Paramormyrops kingsleyae]
MSRSDFPPSYDESKNPLNSPQGRNDYPPPGYGLPPYGGPTAPGGYPPGPQLGPQPGYPAMYPPGGQPAPGYPGQGFPAMPIMPPVLPPVLPINQPDSGGNEGFTSSGDWDDMSIRHVFIRKVYLILASQLLITVAIVAIFTFVDPVKSFVIKNPGFYWASYAVYFVTYLVLVCCKGPRRRFPWNILLLVIFTLSMSYMTGTIASYYDTKSVFLALGITAVVCIIVTIFCFQTKVDFTSCGGFFCVLGMVVFVTGIITAIVLSFKYIPWLHMLYAAIGAIAFTLFLAYHTQLLLGNRKHSISPEEYVYGALSLYLDIVQIFLFILQIVGASRR